MTTRRKTPALPSNGLRRPALDWIDAARGLAILLVVSHHAIWFCLALGLADPRWALVDAAFNTFRMPVFFAVSGVLAGSAVRRTWRGLASGRVLTLLWVYVVWTVLVELIGTFLPLGRGGLPGPGAVAVRVLTGDSNAWYLYGLVAFLAVAKLTNWVGSGLLVGVAAAVSLVFGSDLLAPDNLAWHSMGMYAVFFFAGVRWRDRVLRLPSSGATWWAALAGLAVYAASTAAAFAVLGADVLSVPGVKLALSLVALAAGYVVSVWLAGVVVGRPVVALGRLTLPFYVMHTLAARALLLVVLAVGELFAGGPAALVLPLVLIAATVALVAVVRLPLARAPGLFAPPSRLRRALALAETVDLRTPAAARVVRARPAPDDAARSGALD